MAGHKESPDSEAGHANRRDQHWFDRLIMFSDGVFAIAATLLSLDIRGPQDWNNFSELWSGLAPQLDTYALSFLVIAIYWLGHRRFMAEITKIDAPFTVLTLIMLALVGLVPGATHIEHGPAGMIIYASLIILIGLSLATIWGYAALVADLVSPQVSRASRWFQLAVMAITPPLFLTLVNLLNLPSSALVPPVLAGLFLIGWPMRVWILRRLEKPPLPS